MSGLSLERAFFTNSGTEAMEAALKLVRRVAFDRGCPDRYEVISFEGSFHGRTFGGLSATAQPKYHKGFGPLLPRNGLLAVRGSGCFG